MRHRGTAALIALGDTESIHSVIEDPPMQTTALHVGDVYTVDARGSNNQFGRNNEARIN